MHGLDIVQDLIKGITREAEKRKIKKIGKIYVELGERSGIDEEELNLCFNILSKATLMEGATLEIKKTQTNEIMVDTIEGE